MQVSQTIKTISNYDQKYLYYILYMLQYVWGCFQCQTKVTLIVQKLWNRGSNPVSRSLADLQMQMITGSVAKRIHCRRTCDDCSNILGFTFWLNLIGKSTYEHFILIRSIFHFIDNCGSLLSVKYQQLIIKNMYLWWHQVAVNTLQ